MKPSVYKEEDFTGNPRKTTVKNFHPLIRTCICGKCKLGLNEEQRKEFQKLVKKLKGTLDTEVRE